MKQGVRIQNSEFRSQKSVFVCVNPWLRIGALGALAVQFSFPTTP